MKSRKKKCVINDYHMYQHVEDKGEGHTANAYKYMQMHILRYWSYGTGQVQLNNQQKGTKCDDGPEGQTCHNFSAITSLREFWVLHNSYGTCKYWF